MVQIQFNGQFLVGNENYDFGISDLTLIVDQNDETILVSVSRGNGGVVAWNLSDSTTPDLISLRSYGTEFASGVGSTIIALDQPSGTGLLMMGLNEGGVALSETNGHGGVRPLSDAHVLGVDWTTGVQLDTGFVALADTNGSGFSLFSYADDTLSLHATILDTPATHASAITAMASFGDILITGSGSEFGISSYTTTTTVTHVSTFGPDSGLGVMAPTAITTVDIDGQGYAIVASVGGSAGALSVFSIGADGSLIPTDHIMDTLHSRFGAVQDVAVAPLGDGALVVAGGGDDGLAVMALMPNGHLVHLTSLEDTATFALSGVTALTLTITGDTATIFAATQGDAGFSSMSIDLSDLGDWAISDGGLQNGTSQDDILMTGTSATTLDGGSGSDIFVITDDGDAAHKVWNFDPTQDRLDLSDWSFLYSTNSLTFREIWNGVVITHRDETLTVTGVSNQPLSIADVIDAIDLDVMRIPTIPNDTIMGTSDSDTLSGNWAADTIYGSGGSDILYGGAGDDILLSGSGSDTLIGGSGNDQMVGGNGTDRAILNGGSDFTVLAYNAAEQTVTLQTADGIDTFQSIEVFDIGGTIYTFADLAPPVLSLYGTRGDDVLSSGTQGFTLDGGAGHDILTGNTGNDTIFGGDGNDELIGSLGDDILMGGAGDDIILSGGGDDQINAGAANDSITGGSGTDTYIADHDLASAFVVGWDDTTVTLQSSQGYDIITDVEHFEFNDITASFDDLEPAPLAPRIMGTSSNDVMRGETGIDHIAGSGGDDVIFGSEGGDHLYGGGGNDRLEGEDGNDQIYGEAGADILYGQGGDDLMFGDTGHDSLIGGNGNDLMFGGNGDDFLNGGKLNDQLSGGIGDDDLRGDDHNDILWGEDGNDELRGGRQNDALYGGNGNDVLKAGAGNDTLTGGAGNDTLTGGNDADTFVFSPEHGTDVITDYEVSRDTLMLDAQLVGEALSGQDVIDMFGSQTESGARLTFDDGSVINFDGVTLSDDLALTISVI